MFCGSCGAQPSSPDQRFCAACGQPLAAPAPVPVPAPAPAQQWAPEPATQPATEPSTQPVPDPVGAPPPARGRRVGLRTILVVAGVVVALVVGSITAWSLIRPKGGSDSPEAAVRAFLAAAEKQDVVGLLDQVNPGEVKGFVTAYEAARERATDEDLVGGGDIAAAFGVDLTGLELETHQEADNIAQVTLEGGSYDLTYDPAKVPGRLSTIAEAHPDKLSWQGDLLETDQDGAPLWAEFWPVWWTPADPFAEDSDYEQVYREIRPSLDAVRVDGRWYVSLVRIGSYFVFYEGAGNYVPGYGELDWSAVDGEVEPIVGETPEDVVTHLVDAVNSLDPDDLLDSFPADEVVALRPLGAVAERMARDELGGVDVSVDDLDLSTEDRGDTVVVTLERGRATGSSDDGYGEVEYAQGCFYGTFGEECFSDEPGFEPIRDPFVVMEKVDGGYQLSWSATAAEYVMLYAESMPDRLIDDVVEDLEYETGVY
jgi:hypothetical protein